MKNRSCLALALALMGCGAAATPAPVPAPAVLDPACPDWVHDATDGVAWELSGDEDAIQTWVGKVPDSDFVAFKGAGPIDAPLAKVANVLIDTTRHAEWVPHFGGMRTVRTLSETEQVIYRHVTTPFIISDRDFVVKARIFKEPVTHHLRIEFSSVEDPDAPVEGDKVRGTLHASGYRLWPIDGGARTMMVFTIHVDPQGDIPAWIVNLFQKGYARTNLENIRRQASKPDVVAHPKIEAEFEGSLRQSGGCGTAPTSSGAAPR